MARFLDTLRQAILDKEGTLSAAEDRVGIPKRFLERRLSGRRNFDVSTLLGLVDQLEIDLHDVLTRSGRFTEGLSAMGSILSVLGADAKANQPAQQLAKLVKRIDRFTTNGRLRFSLPTDGFDASPGDLLFRAEKVRRRSTRSFKRLLERELEGRLPQLQRVRNYSATDLRDAADLIYLTANAQSEDVATAFSTLAISYKLPLNKNCHSRIWSDSLACKLFRSAGRTDLALAYESELLPRAILASSELAGRTWMGIANTFALQDKRDLEWKAMVKAQQSSPETYIGYQASFNLSVAAARQSKWDLALQFLKTIEMESPSAAADPQFVFRVLWLEANIEQHLGHDTLAGALFVQALHYKTELQDPKTLLLLAAELLEARILTIESAQFEVARVLRFARNLRSAPVSRIAEGISKQLAEYSGPEIKSLKV